MASLSQGRTAAAQCGLFTYKSVPVIFEPPCTYENMAEGTYFDATDFLGWNHSHIQPFKIIFQSFSVTVVSFVIQWHFMRYNVHRSHELLSMFRRVLSSRMSRRVVWQKYTEFSGNYVAFVIRVDDNGDGRIFWSVCTIYHTTRCHIPDDKNLHIRHSESLKSHCISIICILFFSASVIPIVSDNYFHVL